MVNDSKIYKESLQSHHSLHFVKDAAFHNENWTKIATNQNYNEDKEYILDMVHYDESLRPFAKDLLNDK